MIESRAGSIETERITVIDPRSSRLATKLHEAWEARELLGFLVWRDLSVRYKQTAFGVAWAVVQPLLMMLVFVLFLGRVNGLRPSGVPYPLFTYVGLVPWTLFSQALTSAAKSLLDNRNILSKIYFPRLLLPAAATGSFVVDFVVALALVFALMGYYGVTPSLPFLAVPVLAVLVLVAALSVGIWLSALNVRYRDVGYAVPFLVQLWLFASPVAYSASVVPERWRLLYAVNPVAGPLEGFRWAVIGAGRAPWGMMAVSAGASLVVLGASLAYFQRVEQTFADVI
jgi:homopolymeric O-antigen transport system permease protein